MARKKAPAFIPSDEYQVAFQHAVETAHICAARLFGEPLAEDPANEASPRALMMAMGMMYFLMRLAPEDMRGLISEGGLHVTFWKPFPPGYTATGKGTFADYFTM